MTTPLHRSHRLARCAALLLSGTPLAAWAEQFDVGTAFLAPTPNSQLIYVFDRSTDQNYSSTLDFGRAGGDPFLAVSPSREALFAVRYEGSDKRLYRFGADGTRQSWTFNQGTLAGANLPFVHIAFSNTGNLLISNHVGSGGIMEVTQNGQYVRTISTGGKPLYAAAAIPGTNKIYGVDGEIGGGRNQMYQIDALNGGVISQYTVISNTSNLAYLPSGELAVHAFYNSSWGTAVYTQSGTRTRTSYPAGSGSQYESGWSRGFAYDPTYDHFLNADYAITHIDNKPDATGKMPLVRELPGDPTWDRFTMHTPAGRLGLNYPAVAVAGQFAMTVAPPVYQQRGASASAWASQPLLGSSSYTMSSSGCYVTATTMALGMLGHTTDPGQFNQVMTEVYDGQHNDGILRWWKIPQATTYGQTNGVAASPVRFLGGNFAADASKQAVIDRVAQLIQDSGPVILTLPQYGDGLTNYNNAANLRTHAVTAWKVENNTIYIRNPLTQNNVSDQAAITLDDYVAWVNSSVSGGAQLDADYAFLRSRGFTYAQRVSAAAQQVYTGGVNSPIDLVITDPLGRKLGFDPTTGTRYDQIPDSAYFRLSSGDVDALPGEHTPLSFQIGQPLEGQYVFQVFGLGSGSYSIEMGRSDEAGFASLDVLNGMTSAGQMQSFTFDQVSGFAAVPEPATVSLVAMAGLGLRRRRSR